ncbi:hypothetical protein ACFWH1_28125 [Streptomyces sp. NPDC127037]|uniref:hypothetical protein n=1 Tax=Streptomyces sp. NPDC127037 TaxID=3347113 RepID=UPI003665F2A9
MQFSIADVACAAARALPGGWGVKRGDWGVSATLFSGSRSFRLYVDEHGDLCLDYERPADERLPEVMPRGVGVYHGGSFFEAARPGEGLHALSGKIASAVESAVTGTLVEIPKPTTPMALANAHAEHGPALSYPITGRLSCHSAGHHTPAAATHMVSYLGLTLPACDNHRAHAVDAARELHDLS